MKLLVSEALMRSGDRYNFVYISEHDSQCVCHCRAI
ncbi:hypothetical protein NC651_014130 [Populus alba x Populus x berolinensis]|nr:hypothetical protein NC651_014130 [Populus alba x Populus x berolinensis]